MKKYFTVLTLIAVVAFLAGFATFDSYRSELRRWPGVGAYTVPDTTSGTMTIYKLSNMAGTECLVVNWESNTSGTVFGKIRDVGGSVVGVDFSVNARTYPSNLYDVDIVKSLSGVSILGSLGTDLTTATAHSVCAFIGDGTSSTTQHSVMGDLDFLVQHAGNAKSGQTCIYIKR